MPTPPIYHTDSYRVVATRQIGREQDERTVLIPIHGFNWRRVVGVSEVPHADVYRIMPKSTVRLHEFTLTAFPEKGVAERLHPLAILLDTGATLYAWGESIAEVFALEIEFHS